MQHQYGIPLHPIKEFHVDNREVEQTVRPEMTPSYQRVFNQSFTQESREVELYSDLQSFMLAKAKRLFEEGKKKEALQFLLKAQTNQQPLEAILLIATIAKELHLESKDIDADYYYFISKNALLQAASNPSISKEAYESLGFLHLQANKPALAIDAFQQINSPKVSILLQLARLQFSRNSYEESLDYYFRVYFNRFANADEKKEALEKLYTLSLELEKITDAFTFGELIDRMKGLEILPGSHSLGIIQFYCKKETLKSLKACFNHLVRKRILNLEPYKQVLDYFAKIGQNKIVIELSKKMLDKLPCLDPAFAKQHLVLAYYAEKDFKQCYEMTNTLDYTKCESKDVLLAWGFSSLKKGIPLEASIIFSEMLSRNFLRKDECLSIFHEFGFSGYLELALMMLNRSEFFSDFEKKEYSEQLKSYSEKLKSTVDKPLIEKESTNEEEEELEVGSIRSDSPNLYFPLTQLSSNLTKEQQNLEFKKSACLLVKNLFFDSDIRNLLQETFEKYGIFGIPFPSGKSDEYLEKLYRFLMTNAERKAEALFLAKLLITIFLPLCPQVGETFSCIYEKYRELMPIFKTSEFAVLAIREQLFIPIFPINELLDLIYYLTLKHIQFGTPLKDLLPLSTFYISIKITRENVVFITPFAISFRKRNIEIQKTTLPEVSLGGLHEQLGLNRKGLSLLLNFLSKKENKVIVRLEGIPLIEASNFNFKVEENSFDLFNAQALLALFRSFAETSFLAFPKLPSLPPLSEEMRRRPIFLKSDLKRGAASLFSILINHTSKSPFFFLVEENNKSLFLKELKKQAVIHFLNTWITLTDLNACKINAFYSDYKSIGAFFKEELIDYKQSFQNINLTSEEKKQRETKLEELKNLMDLLSHVRIIIGERASKLNLSLFSGQLDDPTPSFTTFLTSFSPCPNDSKNTKVIICGFNEWEKINKDIFNYPTIHLQEKSKFILEELFLIEKLTFGEVSRDTLPILRSFKTTFEEILNSVVYTVSNNFDLKITYSLLKVLFLMNETYLREKKNFTEEFDDLREIEPRDEKEKLQMRFKNFLEEINRYFLESEKPRIIFFEEISFILNSFIKQDANQLILDLKKPTCKVLSEFKGSGSKKRIHVEPLPKKTSETDHLENLSQKIAILSKKRRKEATNEPKEIPNKSFSNEIVIKPEDLFLIKEK